MIKKTKNKYYSGVTLMELIIVIAIIGILAGVAVVSMGSTSQATKLEAAQREVASEIKLAQAYALQGKTQSGVTPCGYGVHFLTNKQYAIFYNGRAAGKTCEDVNNDKDNTYINYRKFTSGISTQLNAKTLSYDVTFSGATNDIYFTVPNAVVYNSSGIRLAGSEVISNLLTNSFGSKHVELNMNGLIDVEP